MQRMKTANLKENCFMYKSHLMYTTYAPAFCVNIWYKKSDKDCVVDDTFWSEISDSASVVYAIKVNCRILFGSSDILLQIISLPK